MQLLLDLDSEVPIYQQIRDRVVEAIADGTLKPGESLPSTRQCAVDLAINFHTVNKAYDLLRREGIIRINRKSGAVVHPDVGRPTPELRSGDDWRPRLRVLLAEAVVRGVPEEEISAYVRSALDGFALGGGGEGGEGGG
ncbi:GntR family transcriptional regulator [Streptomyces sp. NPDC058372]|uniref:GntR family transcriptional regulator n=1 Tax=Streptomyces sp. NPDC058372 TaxID=3346464 RepID=UPI00364D6B35